MYMFGPSILAQPNFEYYGKTYPTSNWCTVYGGLSQSLFCFNNQVAAKYDGQQLVIINEGTITPLYSFNRTKVATGVDNFTSSDDLKTGNFTLDLHVFNEKQGNGTSKGELLLDDGLGTVDGANKYCYIKFEMNRELSTIQFTDVSQNSGKTNCNTMKSY